MLKLQQQKLRSELPCQNCFKIIYFVLEVIWEWKVHAKVILEDHWWLSENFRINVIKTIYLQPQFKKSYYPFNQRLLTSLNSKLHSISPPGLQIAVVQGGIRNCGDKDYPGIFVRLDDPAILNFIKSIVNNNINTEGKNLQ